MKLNLHNLAVYPDNNAQFESVVTQIKKFMTLIDEKIIPQFLDDTEPLGEVTVNGKTYQVTSPENLLEEQYIAYFAGRSEAMDAYINIFGQEDENGTVVLVQTKDAKDAVRKAKLEAQMLAPARKMIEALLGQPVGTFKRLRSKTIMGIYNHLQTLLDEIGQTPEQDGVTPVQQEELDVPLDSKIEQE